MLIGYVALTLRVILLGTERIFLKKLERYNSVGVASLFFLIAGVLLSPVIFFIPSNAYHIPLKTFLLAILSSSAYAIGFFAYVKAISLGDTSLVAPLYNSSILWLMILGLLFLGDDVTVFRAAGGLLMFIGLFFLYRGSLKEKIKAILESKSSLLMIMGSLFIAFGRTLDTLIIRTINEILYAWLTNFLIGSILLVYLLVRGTRFPDLRAIIQGEPKHLFFASLSNGWSYLFLLIAIQNLQVTVAEPISLLSTFVTAFLAKKYLDEMVEERLLGMVIMIVGAVFVLTL
ncbi:MAG: DMT family transporter [Methanobacteriota archaeon]|nr:MAG: DMT family transporter [Euryarchaeota archaeon]